MDVEVVEPTHRHHPVGEHWLDKVLPISAILISVVSIWIAYHHGEVMQKLVDQNERLVAANSLPHLGVALTESVGLAGQQNIKFTVSNGGVGPADIRTAEVLLDGQAVPSSNELLKRCCKLDTREYYWNPLRNHMIRPGESLNFLNIVTRPETQSAMPLLSDAIEKGRIVARVCYCSVFSDCWIGTSQLDQRPQPVGKQCPAPKIAYAR